MEHNIKPVNNETHPLAPPHLTHMTTPTHIKSNPIKYPIHSIINQYIKPIKNKYQIIKKTIHIPMPMDIIEWCNL